MRSERRSALFCSYLTRPAVLVALAGTGLLSIPPAATASFLSDIVGSVGKVQSTGAAIQEGARRNDAITVQQSATEQARTIEATAQAAAAAQAAASAEAVKGDVRQAADATLADIAGSRDKFADLASSSAWKVSGLRWGVFVAAAISAFVLAFFSKWSGSRVAALFCTLLATVGQGADTTFGYTKDYGRFKRAAVNLGYCYRNCRDNVASKFLIDSDVTVLTKDVVALLGACREQEQKYVEQAESDETPVEPPKLEITPK